MPPPCSGLTQRTRISRTEMAQAAQPDSAAEAEVGERGPGGQQWDYKGLVITKFALSKDGHADGAHLAPDSAEMRALASAFDADAGGFRPRTVVLQGPAGSGKSALARRVLLGWARDELFQHTFSHVFLLAAREAQSAHEGSLAELVSREWADSPAPLEDVLSRPEGLLFVLDGFDDPALGLQAGREVCEHWAEKRPAAVLARSLLSKALLPACSLLVMARDAGVGALMSLLVSPRFLVLGGVLLEQSVRLLQERSDPGLQAAGEPVVCVLLGEALRLQQVAGGTPGQTVTGLYATFVFQQLAPGDAAPKRLGQTGRAVLRGLCRLAAEGLWGLRGTFAAEDVQGCGLQQPELCGLLHARCLLPGLGGETCYAFLHPSLQEFCAALHYVLDGLDRDPAPGTPLLESTSLPAPAQAGIGAHMGQMKRFLFGLVGGEVAGTLGVLLGQPVPPGLRERLLRWVSLLSRPAGTPAPQDMLEAFYCLFETQDAEFARSALSGFRELRLRLHRRADWAVAAFCLQHCRGLRRLRADVQEERSGGQAAAGTQVETLTAECWEKMCSVLSTHPSLQQLELSGSLLEEWAMKTLCVKMRQPACKIQTLKFEGAQISLGLRHLWRVLITNPNIKSLSLESSTLNGEDVAMACEALKHPSCSLESLRLDRCGLPRACAPEIARILETCQSLQCLSLAGNRLGGRGVGPLREALEASPCALQRLVLGSCGLSTADCRDLAAGLGSNRSLTHLCLSGNALGSEGASALCQALRRPGCGLQRLLLDGCDLDVAACGFLAFALMDNPQLTHLSLSANPVRDDGARLLCEAVASPACHLRDLALAGCRLTAACCKSLAAAVGRSRHLRALDLAANALGDAGVAALCEGLKQRGSTLERLGLEACELTDAGCEALSSALGVNERLAGLNLARNHFGAAGAQQLCRAFTRPASALRSVGLWTQQYPAEVRALLEEARLRRPGAEIADGWWARAEDGRDWWRS
ncbi:NACHT, LRR and PYD domains-containing protein 5 [Talpa occidentalis]|uniref:NACHT, LRR and PYD domains-containing protein 5 n=1 Tax=Talpa occidentalis TaxID=50954 RepID=UPI00188E4A52|nr:NACHT, LRR and PYD domains-containing protein 5 [Talpa occidentalis]